jgi:hypothetical protein
MAFPEIIVVGAQKCGTSALHRWLVDYAGVSAPRDPESGKALKEVHFFTNNWDRGSPWYESHFESTCSVDASPNYLSDTRAHERLKSVVPDAKIVICLRNPIDRAFSQYNHYKQELPRSASYDWERPDADFHTNVLAELGKIEQHVEVYRGLVARGLYLPQIRSVQAHFDADQVHITVMEHWDMRESVMRLAKFLGVAAPSRLPVAHKRAYTVEPLQQRTVDALRSFFRPHNDDLCEHLGFALPEWL